MKKVILHGKLGKRFGESHLLAVKTPGECLVALDVLFDGFRMHLMEAAKKGVVYAIRNEKKEFIKCEEYNFKTSDSSLHIMPLPQGGFMTLLGVAATTYLGMWLSSLFQIDPVIAGKRLKNESYIYNGATTVTKQGGVVPIGYGRLRVGPTIISDNILNYDYDLDRGVIMGFNRGGDADLFVGSSSYAYTSVKNENDLTIGPRGSLGGFIYQDGSDNYGMWEFTDAAGNRQLAYKGTTQEGRGMVKLDGEELHADEPIPVDKTDSPWINTTEGQLNVSISALRNLARAVDDACVTQTFPLNMDGTVNPLYVPDAPIYESVAEDSSKKFRNLGGIGLNKGTTIVVGPRYIGGDKNKGLGWTPLSSTSIKKTVGLICEGVIEGLVDANGTKKEYDYKLATNENVEYLKGVYINDVPVQETTTNSFNVPKFDFDLGTSANKIKMGDACDIGGGEEYLIGPNDQRLLRPEYLYAGNTHGKNAVLYGPRVDSASPGAGYNAAITKSSPYPEEEFFVSHIITNPNIEFAIVSIKINELFYVYEGDESRVEIKLGSLLGAIIGALLAYMFVKDATNKLSIAAVAQSAAVASSGATSAALSAVGPTSVSPAGAAAAAVAAGVGIVALEAVAVGTTAKTALSAALKILAGAAIGAIIGNNLNLYSGRKIDNSGESWPNILQFRVRTSNEGDESAEYVTNMRVHGVATEPYIKDFIIPLPKENPNSSNRLLKVYRTSRQKNSVKEGESAARYRESAELLSITEVFAVKQNYPNTVVFGSRINARDIPDQNTKLSFDLKLKKIRIPSNYNPENRSYDGIWNGLFMGEESFGAKVLESRLRWTDNPAWCFYDLVVNNVYGLGKFGLIPDNIDRWTLYKIAKFCDELIPTGFSPKFPKREFLSVDPLGDPSRVNKITTVLTDDEFKKEFLGLSAAVIASNPDATNNVNAGKSMVLFYGDGTGEVIPILQANIPNRQIALERTPMRARGKMVVQHQYPLLEPRFTCNAFINTKESAYELIQKMAKIFKGTPYWAEGAIFLSQEQKKDAIALFTNNNVGDGGFGYSSSARTQRYNSCTVQYVDKDYSFKPRTEYAEDREGIIKNNLIETNVEGFGITSKGQATRAALYVIEGAKLNNEVIEFKTDVIGSYLRPGDIFNVIDTNRTIAKCEGKVIETYPFSGKGGALRIKVDYPVKQMVKAADPNSWLKINLYTPSANKNIKDLKGETRLTDYTIGRLRQSQVSEFYVTGISDNDRMLHLQYNPFTFVSGDYTQTQAKDEAALHNGSLAEIDSKLKQDLVNHTLPSGAVGWIGAKAVEKPSLKFMWESDERTITYNNWYNSAIPSAVFSFRNPTMYVKASGIGGATDFGTWGLNKKSQQDNYIFEDNGLDATKITEGTSYIIESNTNLADFRQYRTVNVVEQNPGVFKINGIKYNKSKYENIEKNMSITMPEIPPIHIVTPGDPASLVLTKPTANSVVAQWDIVPGALGYKLDLYRNDGIVQSFQIPQNYNVTSMTHTINTQGVVGTYSAKIYSTI